VREPGDGDAVHLDHRRMPVEGDTLEAAGSAETSIVDQDANIEIPHLLADARGRVLRFEVGGDDAALRPVLP